jgi:dodecin
MPAVFEYTEVVGISTQSFENAIEQAVASVAKTKHIGWFEVLSTRGRMTDDGKLEYQVTVKCGVKNKE